MPDPPNSSGIRMPGQPSCAMLPQVALSKPCSVPASRIARKRATGASAATQDFACSLTTICSSLSTAIGSTLLRLLGQAENVLGDDVVLDLVGSAVDRHRLPREPAP